MRWNGDILLSFSAAWASWILIDPVQLLEGSSFLSALSINTTFSFLWNSEGEREGVEEQLLQKKRKNSRHLTNKRIAFLQIKFALFGSIELLSCYPFLWDPTEPLEVNKSNGR